MNGPVDLRTLDALRAWNYRLDLGCIGWLGPFYGLIEKYTTVHAYRR